MHVVRIHFFNRQSERFQLKSGRRALLDVVDILQSICLTHTVKAVNHQSWWKRVVSSPQAEVQCNVMYAITFDHSSVFH